MIPSKTVPINPRIEAIEELKSRLFEKHEQLVQSLRPGLFADLNAIVEDESARAPSGCEGSGAAATAAAVTASTPVTTAGKTEPESSAASKLTPWGKAVKLKGKLEAIHGCYCLLQPPLLLISVFFCNQQ